MCLNANSFQLLSGCPVGGQVGPKSAKALAIRQANKIGFKIQTTHTKKDRMTFPGKSIYVCAACQVHSLINRHPKKRDEDKKALIGSSSFIISWTYQSQTSAVFFCPSQVKAPGVGKDGGAQSAPCPFRVCLSQDKYLMTTSRVMEWALDVFEAGKKTGTKTSAKTWSWWL